MARIYCSATDPDLGRLEGKRVERRRDPVSSSKQHTNRRLWGASIWSYEGLPTEESGALQEIGKPKPD